MTEANIRIWMGSEIAGPAREWRLHLPKPSIGGAENTRIGFSKSGRDEVIRQRWWQRPGLPPDLTESLPATGFISLQPWLKDMLLVALTPVIANAIRHEVIRQVGCTWCTTQLRQRHWYKVHPVHQTRSSRYRSSYFSGGMVHGMHPTGYYRLSRHGPAGLSMAWRAGTVHKKPVQRLRC